MVSHYLLSLFKLNRQIISDVLDALLNGLCINRNLSRKRNFAAHVNGIFNFIK